MTPLFEKVQVDAYRHQSAVVSADARFRYALVREWDRYRPRVLFVMLNPSTADAHRDDPTVRKCAQIAKSLGYGTLAVANLFALRSTDPWALRSALDPIGPENDAYLARLAKSARLTVCAWGDHGAYLSRNHAVWSLLTGAGATPKCLALTKAGEPGHPLYRAGPWIPRVFVYHGDSAKILEARA